MGGGKPVVNTTYVIFQMKHFIYRYFIIERFFRRCKDISFPINMQQKYI